MAMGHWPVLFHGPVFGAMDNSQGAHIYVDVSGSVSGLTGRIYGLVLALANEVALPVHLFSNRIMDLTMDDLAHGRVRTTGGTDFDCVVTHALEHGYRRVVVITDGMGEIATDNAEAFRASGASLYLLLTGMGIGYGKFPSPISSLARQVWDMEV